MEILRTENLKKYYDQNMVCVKALDGVDLSVEQGEFVAIVGTSGSGKSTLLHMLGGLDRPTAGTVLVDGKKIFDLKEEELTAEFGENGWKQLPDAISRCYQFIPASVVIEEHHIGVYSSKLDEHMIKAPHPRNLLHGSLVSPSLAAAVINGKYVNAVPLYRLEKEFERYGLAITRQNMANWMIRLGEEYLGTMYDYLHKLLYDYHVIQADETPVLVNKDGRPAGSQSYMWVYRSGFMYRDRQIIRYE